MGEPARELRPRSERVARPSRTVSAGGGRLWSGRTARTSDLSVNMNGPSNPPDPSRLITTSNGAGSSEAGRGEVQRLFAAAVDGDPLAHAQLGVRAANDLDAARALAALPPCPALTVTSRAPAWASAYVDQLLAHVAELSGRER